MVSGERRRRVSALYLFVDAVADIVQVSDSDVHTV